MDKLCSYCRGYTLLFVVGWNCFTYHINIYILYITLHILLLLLFRYIICIYLRGVIGITSILPDVWNKKYYCCILYKLYVIFTWEWQCVVFLPIWNRDSVVAINVTARHPIRNSLLINFSVNSNHMFFRRERSMNIQVCIEIFIVFRKIGILLRVKGRSVFRRYWIDAIWKNQKDGFERVGQTHQTGIGSFPVWRDTPNSYKLY